MFPRPAGLATLAFLTTVASPAATAPHLERLPLRFEANTGQADREVKFYTKASDYTLYLTARESVLVLGRDTLKMRLRGANPRPSAEGEEKLTSRSSYFLGGRRQSWRGDVPHYARVRYRQVYPGIDLVYYGRERRVEHDFIVAPGSDPARIRFEYQGAQRLALDASGDLVLNVGRDRVKQLRPVAYQEIGGRRRLVEASYRIIGRNLVGFTLGAYDEAAPLVIDPVLAYSSYIGGSGVDVATAVTVDSAGFLWVAGYTNSNDFPAAGDPIQAERSTGRDVFVAKFDPKAGEGAGALAYVTYLGGTADDEPRKIVARGGLIYLAGTTASGDFPLAGGSAQSTSGGDVDTFVVMLNPSDNGSGALWYSSYVGGPGADIAQALAVDSAGQFYVAGYTTSGSTTNVDFPLSQNRLQGSNRGGYDAFFYVVAPGLSGSSGLVYSTYLGAGGTDVATGVILDAAGRVILTGYTTSPDFPLAGDPLQADNRGRGDAFLARLDLSKSGLDALDYATLFGGGDLEIPYSILIDPAGAVTIAGYTLSPDLPVTPTAAQAASGGDADVFLAKFGLGQSSATLLYSTYLGGSKADIAYGLAQDAAGRYYLTGYTHSENFPIAGQAIQPGVSAPPDAFAAIINPSVPGRDSLIWSAVAGGDGTDAAYALAGDGAGGLFVVGLTQSRTLPVTGAALMNQLNGLWDGFLLKIDLTK